jgi:serine/threonine protein kinase
VSQFGGLNETIIKRYMHQIVDALCHLHTRGIVHGNLTLDHLLITSTETTSGCIKLSGLGSATRMLPGCKRAAAYVDGDAAAVAAVVMCRWLRCSVLRRFVLLFCSPLLCIVLPYRPYLTRLPLMCALSSQSRRLGHRPVAAGDGCGTAAWGECPHIAAFS